MRGAGSTTARPRRLAPPLTRSLSLSLALTPPLTPTLPLTLPLTLTRSEDFDAAKHYKQLLDAVGA